MPPSSDFQSTLCGAMYAPQHLSTSRRLLACCYPLCCSRCMTSRQYNYLRNNNTKFSIDWGHLCLGCTGDACGLFCMLPYVWSTYQTFEVRQMIRERFHFRQGGRVVGDPLAVTSASTASMVPMTISFVDLATVSCCTSCAAAQHDVEIVSRRLVLKDASRAPSMQ